MAARSGQDHHVRVERRRRARVRHVPPGRGAAAQLVVGDQLQIGTGANLESVSVVTVSGSSVAIFPEKFTHGAGDRVLRTGGAIRYRDAELPQDACAAGRALAFGKTSEPALTKALGIVPFASGLSPNGKLVAAQTSKPVFYGAPVVNWQPALGASAYEVQWSKAGYPFEPAATPVLTYATSTVLALTPGHWWYRVRGLNLHPPPVPARWAGPTRSPSSSRGRGTGRPDRTLGRHGHAPGSDPRPWPRRTTGSGRCTRLVSGPAPRPVSDTSEGLTPRPGGNRLSRWGQRAAVRTASS